MRCHRLGRGQHPSLLRTVEDTHRAGRRGGPEPDGRRVRLARRIAEHEPFASWLVREVFPGPEVTSDEELSAVARATHQTVYHVSGTCRMGAEDDPGAVLHPDLTLRGVHGLRVVDASVFPQLVSTNPVVTVMLVAERAADLIAAARRGELSLQTM